MNLLVKSGYKPDMKYKFWKKLKVVYYLWLHTKNQNIKIWWILLFLASLLACEQPLKNHLISKFLNF
jgi:hypothetical protein